MLFSRAVSFAAFLLVSSSLTSAAPTASAALVPVGSDSSVVGVDNVLHTLQGNCGGILLQISGVDSGVSSVSPGVSSVSPGVSSVSPGVSSVSPGVSSVSPGVSSGNNVTTVTSIEPLVSQLIAVINTATTTIGATSSLSGSATTAVDVTSTVNLLLTIVLQIVSDLVNLVANVTGDLSMLLAGIDVVLSNLVVSVGASLSLTGSILSSASIDVSSLAGTLTSLSLTKTLNALITVQL